MRNLKIFTKLFLSHTTLGLGAVIILSIIFYFSLRNALIQRTVDQLSSINILKKDLIENYFDQSQLGIRALHIDNKFFNLFSIVSERDLIEAENKPEFKNLINDLLNLYDFENVAIFDRNGQQIFSTKNTYSVYPGVMKAIDSLTSDSPDNLHIVDLSNFVLPLQTVVVHYVPVYDETTKIGVVLLQENFNHLEEVLLEHTGMGSTGETYMVGHDFRMRTASRFFPDSIPMTIEAHTEAVKHSFNDSNGPYIIDDYRGIKVLSAYRRLNVPGLDWAIMSEIDFDEAMKPIIQLRNYLAGIVVALILITLIFTYILSKNIAQPILKLRTIIQSLSKGVIPKAKPVVKSSDEIGQITEAMVQLISGLERTTTFAKEIGSGNFDVSFTTLSKKDTLGLALVQMRDELKGFHIREIKMARERASALIEGQEYERQRITQDLHDGVGQFLTSIRIRVELMENNESLKQDLKNQINETIAEIKRISYNVMPQALVDYGLEAALKGLCDNIGKFSSIVIDFRYIQEAQVKHEFELSTTVFRIVQEGLNNIVKHSQATDVNLHILDRDDSIYLILEDNGVGFDENGDEFKPGSGLHNMKERAKLLNGTTEIHSIPGTGTVIEVTIPTKSQHDE
jgi:signal transduction histidine kinase